MWALRRIGTPEATQKLVVALPNSDFPADLRRIAARVLIQINWEPVTDAEREALTQFREKPPETCLQCSVRTWLCRMDGARFETCKNLAFEVAATGELSALDGLRDDKNAPRPIDTYYGDDYGMERSNDAAREEQARGVAQVREETVRKLLQNATTE